jgi:hypothetical protein
MASGVLPICVGEATKLAPFLSRRTRSTRPPCASGVETDTLDAEGRVVATAEVGALSGRRHRGRPRPLPRAHQSGPAHVLGAQACGGPCTATRAPARRWSGRPAGAGARPHPAGLRAARPPGCGCAARRGPTCACWRPIWAGAGPGAHLTALRRIASGPSTWSAALPLDEVLRRIEAASTALRLAERCAGAPAGGARSPRRWRTRCDGASGGLAGPARGARAGSIRVLRATRGWWRWSSRGGRRRSHAAGLQRRSTVATLPAREKTRLPALTRPGFHRTLKRRKTAKNRV